MTKFLISMAVTILYVVVVIPASVLLRGKNKKIMPLEFEVSKDSYWVLKRNLSQVNNSLK
jgi:hypothetical protein